MTHPLDADAVDHTGSAVSRARPTTVRMRASDADRHATVQVLQDGIARGLLTPAEGSERMAAAFAAVHRVDLEPLTADLPPAAASSGQPGWGPQLALLGEQLRSSLHASSLSRHRAAQLAAVLLLLVVLLIVGTAMMHLLLDGGGGPGRGGRGRR